MEYKLIVRQRDSYITFSEDDTSIDLIPYKDGSFSVKGSLNTIVPHGFAILFPEQYELLSKALNYLKTTEGQHLVEKLYHALDSKYIFRGQHF